MPTARYYDGDKEVQNFGAGGNLQYDAVLTYVEKSSENGVKNEPWTPPCAMSVTGEVLGGEFGRFGRQEASETDCVGQSEACYVSSGKLFRLVWGRQSGGRYPLANGETGPFDQSSTGLDRNCVGWILQKKNSTGPQREWCSVAQLRRQS